MKPLSVLLLLAASSVVCGQDKSESARQIVLPSPSLMRCAAAQLWLDEELGPAAVYPLGVTVDRFDKNGCPQGVMATYDKTVSLDEIKASLDRRYGKWAVTRYESTALKLWRVEPEKFAIQLSTIENPKKMGLMGEKGMKLLIYLPFSGPASHSNP